MARSGQREPESVEGERPRAQRWFFAVLAYLFVGLALLGLAVPGLPTTPFVLLAAWAANKGSRRVHDWLHEHPRLGPALADWREERAVATRAKALAVAFLAASWLIMYARGTPRWLLWMLAALFLVVGGFVATRARPSAQR
ncbi:MAG: YbaN family protein [Gemmatimonadota bacterium]